MTPHPTPFLPTNQSQKALLGQLREAAHQLVADYHTATDGLSYNQLNWKPQPSKWSVAEVFVHLNKQEGPYPAAIRAAVQSAPPLKEDGPFHSGLVGKFFIGAVKPGGKPIPAPKMLQPTESTYDRSVVGEWFALQTQFLESLETAAGVDLQRARVSWVVTPLVRFRLGDLFVMLVTHKQRHLEQIHRVLKAEGFPEN